MRRGTLIGASIWCTFAALCVSERAFATSPFTYGYVDVQATCVEASGRKRIKLTSEVFGFCEEEVSRDSIVRDSLYQTNNALRASCLGAATITNHMVLGYSDRQTAEVRRDRAMQEAGFQVHGVVPYIFAAYSGKCR